MEVRLVTGKYRFDLPGFEAFVSPLMRPYEPVGPFAERHGAFQITYYRHLGGLDRYIVLALAEEDEPKVEVIAGAEKSGSCTRRMVALIPVEPTPRFYEGGAQAPLRQAIEHAVREADELSLECADPVKTGRAASSC